MKNSMKKNICDFRESQITWKKGVSNQNISNRKIFSFKINLKEII